MQRQTNHLRVVVQLEVGRVMKGGGEHIEVVPGGIFPLQREDELRRDEHSIDHIT